MSAPLTGLVASEAERVVVDIAVMPGSAKGAEASLKNVPGWFAATGSEHCIFYDLQANHRVLSLCLEATNVEAAPKDVEINLCNNPCFKGADAPSRLQCRHGRHVYALPTPQTGRYLRLQVTSNHGAHYVGINEVEVRAVTTELELAPDVVEREEASFCYANPRPPGLDAQRFPLSQPVTAELFVLQICENMGEFYTGVNSAWLVDQKGQRLTGLQPLAVNGKCEGLASLPVGLGGREEGGWWTGIGGCHEIVVRLPRPATVAAVDMWAANVRACPAACRLCGPASREAVVALERAVRACNSGSAASLGPRASALLATLAQSGAEEEESLGLAVLRRELVEPVLTGAFPPRGTAVSAQDALAVARVRAFDGWCRRLLPGEVPAAPAAAGVLHETGREAFRVPNKGGSDDVAVLACAAESEVKPGWVSTGLFLPPGRTCEVTVIEGEVSDWQLRVGAHHDDVAPFRSDWQRWPRVDREWQLPPAGAAPLLAASPFGGAIYITHSKGSRALQSPELLLQVQGAQPAPWIRSDSSAEDIATEAAKPGAWAELEGHRVILTLPSAELREALATGADLCAALRFWDEVVESHSKLLPLAAPDLRQRIIGDVQPSVGYMHAGYPIYTHLDVWQGSVEEGKVCHMLDAAALRHEGSWGVFHELGHNFQRDAWTFEGTREVTVNLFTLFSHEALCGKSVAAMMEKHREHEAFFAEGPTFARWQNEPFLALRTYSEVIEAFGWEPLKRCLQDYEAPGSFQPQSLEEQIATFVQRLSRHCSHDLRPHFNCWTVPCGHIHSAELDRLPKFCRGC